jgi:hypothetical protein
LLSVFCSLSVFFWGGVLGVLVCVGGVWWM